MVYIGVYVAFIEHEYVTFINNILYFGSKIRLNYVTNFKFIHYHLIKLKMLITLIYSLHNIYMIIFIIFFIY